MFQKGSQVCGHKRQSSTRDTWQRAAEQTQKGRRSAPEQTWSGAPRVPEQVRAHPRLGLTQGPSLGSPRAQPPWADQPRAGPGQCSAAAASGGSRKTANHLHSPRSAPRASGSWAEGWTPSWMRRKATGYERLDSDRSSVNESAHGATARRQSDAGPCARVVWAGADGLPSH